MAQKVFEDITLAGTKELVTIKRLRTSKFALLECSRRFKTAKRNAQKLRHDDHYCFIL